MIDGTDPIDRMGNRFKLGRLPQLQGADRLSIKWAHEYLALPIPEPRYPIEVAPHVKTWGMLGNDTYGDCGVAGRYHYEMATGAPLFPDEMAVNDYLDYVGGPQNDNGVVLASYLLWAFKRGEILGFAPVNLREQARADSLMQIFHGLYVGVALTDDAQALFQRGIWTVANGERPDPSLGHCILKIASDGVKQVRYVTWGAEQAATLDWSAACEDEGWVILTTEEDVALMPSLRTDLASLANMID
jgi:hypothetical protein